MLRLIMVLTALVLSVTAANAEGTITGRASFLLICDIYEMGENSEARGGMARVAGMVATERRANPNLIVVHAGDTLSPSLMSGIDQGAHMIDLLNMLAPDVFVPGNHEFDFGRDVFVRRMSEAKFDIYAANLTDEAGRPLPEIKSHKIVDIAGLKVGIVGLTADDSPQRSSPGTLRFEDTVRTAGRIAGELRRSGADIVVAVVHAARPEDDALLNSGDFDIVLSGDDHDLVVRYDGRRAFAEAMEEGWVAVVLDVDFSIDMDGTKRRVSWRPRFRIIDSADVEPDARMAERVAQYQSLLSKELDRTIGRTSGELDSRNAAVRGGEAAIGNLIADAIRGAKQADAALFNGGGIRGKKLYPAGSEVTRRDVLSELPFGNKTYLLEIAGADLNEALEQAFAKADHLTGAFPQVSGMTVRADLSRPVGMRVVSVKLGGKPLHADKKYFLATNDFLARGGDGLTALMQARIVSGPTDGNLVVNDVMDYIMANGTVNARLEGRVVVARQAPPE